MNNIYKELARQATDYCVDRKENKAWLWEEKFAELIVKECASIITAHTQSTWNGSLILEHFRVEL